MSRREFVAKVALGGAALAFAPGTVRGAAGARSKLLIVLLRGAADGLSVLVPYREKEYARLRPDLAIGPPGRGSKNALDLDGRFGLHPMLEPLARLYHDGSLAFVVATGSPSLTRSHFDAQDYMESGTPDVKTTPDGWLNRYLQRDPERAPATLRAVALSGSMPRILQGPATALAAAATSKLSVRGGRRVRGIENAFADLYAQSSGPVAEAGKEALAAVEQLRETGLAEEDAGMSGRGNRSAAKLIELAKLAAREPELEIGFVDLGGWDTHVQQGGAEGQLARRLEELGNGLSAMTEELGAEMRRTMIVVLTEFGRTVAQNGNGGTDHGHGSVALVLGGPVQGGKVYGRWPGLSPEQLHEGRDLAVTTDFRHVLGEALVRHMGARDLGPVFPRFATGPQQWLGVVRT